VFFNVFFVYIRQALQEIKATGPISTAETGAGKTLEDQRDAGKDESKKKGNYNVDVMLWKYIRITGIYCHILHRNKV